MGCAYFLGKKQGSGAYKSGAYKNKSVYVCKFEIFCKIFSFIIRNSDIALSHSLLLTVLRFCRRKVHILHEMSIQLAQGDKWFSGYGNCVLTQ